MLIYLLFFGAFGGCLYFISLIYKIILSLTKKRKIKPKEILEEEVKKYEGQN